MYIHVECQFRKFIFFSTKYVSELFKIWFFGRINLVCFFSVSVRFTCWRFTAGCLLLAGLIPSLNAFINWHKNINFSSKNRYLIFVIHLFFCFVFFHSNTHCLNPFIINFAYFSNSKKSLLFHQNQFWIGFTLFFRFFLLSWISQIWIHVSLCWKEINKDLKRIIMSHMLSRIMVFVVVIVRAIYTFHLIGTTLVCLLDQFTNKDNKKASLFYF
jgi:hypothetical protein